MSRFAHVGVRVTRSAARVEALSQAKPRHKAICGGKPGDQDRGRPHPRLAQGYFGARDGGNCWVASIHGMHTRSRRGPVGEPPP